MKSNAQNREKGSCFCGFSSRLVTNEKTTLPQGFPRHPRCLPVAHLSRDSYLRSEGTCDEASSTRRYLALSLLVYVTKRCLNEGAAVLTTANQDFTFNRGCAPQRLQTTRFNLIHFSRSTGVSGSKTMSLRVTPPA